MDAKSNIKARLPSRHVTEGPERAPHRSYYYAMCRLNVPAIFIYGGSILPGKFRGQTVTVQDMFEAVGRHSVGAMSDADLDEMEQVACPSAGACGAQVTANTMATVSEAVGLALPNSAGAAAPYEMRGG